ncbi:MAG: hypothetical protein GYA41_06570, partial [Bacteroidales bacterium]|nr:hypothetical protein [Bacteroidales bacterium]
MKLQSVNLVILLLSGTLMSLNSCRKDTVNEITINDFASLSKEFREPAAEYTTAPFFVWNYKITREEIDRYLDEFNRQGSRQVFIHPRPGLVTEYLSDEWFELYRYTVDKARELGMKVWIYDENSYPSGFAGGHVPDQMPESFNQGQGLTMTRCTSLPDTADRFYLCLKEESGQIKNITSALIDEKGKTGSYMLFNKTFNRKSDWYGGFSYVDLLYPGVTEKFLGITMPGYEKHLGDEFGSIVPGIFTDEPQIESPGGIRWTPDLFEVFEKQWNYDLVTNLPSLFEETGDWKRVRHNYTQTLLNLFIDRWAKPYFRYCEKKNLKFTGHYWEHEWPNMNNGGDNMAMYAWHQMPAIDMLFNQWNDSTPGAQFGNVRSVKELASAANQTGRQRKLSETYGGAGWELEFTDMKRLGDWEYVLGVNFMNQHLSHITLAGARKYDYPPTFTYHEPWWENYKFINDHFARLSLALSSGEQLNEILVLEPTTSAWLYDSYTSKNPKMGEIGQSFQTFITRLEKEQVEYDLGSENIIKNLGSVKKSKLVIGYRSYSVVVIPPMTENLNLSTFRLLKEYVSKGGKLIAFSLPTLVDGSLNDELKAFFSSTDIISIGKGPDREIIKVHFSDPQITFLNVTGGNLYHQRRVLADGQLVFLANSSLGEPATGSLKIKGAAAIEFNTLSGEISGYPYTEDGGQIRLSFDLPPAGSLLLFISAMKPDGFSAPAMAGNFEVVPLDSQMKIIRDENNAYPIEFCDIIAGGEISEDLNTYDAADKIFKLHGFKNGNPWNTSVQFKTNIIDRDTFNISSGFKASYHFNVKGQFDFSSVMAVIERPHLWKAEVNGTEITPEEGLWWLDRSFAVFKIGTLIREGVNTITLSTYPMKVHAEVEPVYLKGDFSVRPGPKGWFLEAPVKNLTAGSWKDQGLPFYSWGITYRKEYNIEKPLGKYFVAPGEWNGTVAEVKVNGIKAPLIAFPPYRSDISDLLKPGVNVIDVKVIGSLKNLLGPHFNNPAPGLASPWHWRNVKSYPPGIEYQLIDYGLME